jgi:hypothetical protein
MINTFLFISIFGCLFIESAISAPAGSASNLNVTVSEPGVSNHGKPDLVCIPTKLTDVALFFLSNYLAHALTIRLPAGATSLQTILYVLSSLLFPSNGMWLAVDALSQWRWKPISKFPFYKMENDSLDTAVRAGALVMAVRDSSWSPDTSDGVLRDLSLPEENGGNPPKTGIEEGSDGMTVRTDEQKDRLSNDQIEKTVVHPLKTGKPVRYRVYETKGLSFDISDQFERLVFGKLEVSSLKLPVGYKWTRLPRNSKIRPYGSPVLTNHLSSNSHAEVHIPVSFSVTQPLIAIYQAAAAGWTLYKARGDQLDQFGYTAFALTVTPYLMMSIINFVAQ